MRSRHEVCQHAGESMVPFSAYSRECGGAGEVQEGWQVCFQFVHSPGGPALCQDAFSSDLPPRLPLLCTWVPPVPLCTSLHPPECSVSPPAPPAAWLTLKTFLCNVCLVALKLRAVSRGAWLFQTQTRGHVLGAVDLFSLLPFLSPFLPSSFSPLLLSMSSQIS